MLDPARLDLELKAAGLPITGSAVHKLNDTRPRSNWPATSTWYTRPDAIIRIDWPASPTAAQNSQAASTVAAHGGPTVNDDLERMIFQPKDIAAIILYLTSPPFSRPQWATDVVNAARTRINTLIGSRTPDGGTL